RNRLDDALPQTARVHEHIGLVDPRELLAAAGGRQLERVPHHAFDAERGVHGDLGRDFVRGVSAQAPPVPGVRPLRALAYNYEIDVTGVGQSRCHPRIERARANVCVVLEVEAELQQEAAFDVRTPEPRVTGYAADGPEEARV